MTFDTAQMTTFLSILIEELVYQVYSAKWEARPSPLSFRTTTEWELSVAAVDVRHTHTYQADSSMNQAWYFPFSVSLGLQRKIQ